MGDPWVMFPPRLVRAIVVLVLGATLQWSPGASSDPRGDAAHRADPPQAATTLDERYLALVTRYQHGDFQAIADLLAWKDDEVRKAAGALSRLKVRARPTSAAEVAARVKAAAVMLHTDAGLVDIVERGSRESVHLRIAHEWMLASERSPLGDADTTLKAFTLRNWLLAVVQPLVLRMEYEPARGLLGPRGPGGLYKALLDGKDRDLLLAAGWLEETAALYGARVLTSEAANARVSSEIDATAFMARSQQAAREELLVREARQRAERLYRRVLQLDAASYEATLRLGRVLFDEGQSVEAAIHLQRVIAHSGETRQQYLANLFLGALREREGRIDAAIELYSKALSTDPRGQAARVALAAALDASGQSAPARDEIAALATRRTPDRSYTDPWSAYVLGQAGSDRLLQLRRLVVGE